MSQDFVLTLYIRKIETPIVWENLNLAHFQLDLMMQ